MVHTQCSVTASLMTTVTHCRFFHCYYLQERKTVKNLIFLISFFERYRKLPFTSTQHHCLFINFVRGKKRGRQKMVKTKNYYKNSHYLIIALNTKTDHSFSILVGKSKLFCQVSTEQLAEKWYSTSKHSVYEGQWSIGPSKFWHFWRPGTIGTIFLLRESYCIEENSRIIDKNSGFHTLQGRILTIWQPRSPRMP